MTLKERSHNHIGVYLLVVTLPVMFLGVQLMFEYRQAPPSSHAPQIISATERKNCETELFADANFFSILMPVRPLLSNICCYNHSVKCKNHYIQESA